MAIQINGNGTITGISSGGLPAGTVTSATLATGVGGHSRPWFSSWFHLASRDGSGARKSEGVSNSKTIGQATGRFAGEARWEPAIIHIRFDFAIVPSKASSSRSRRRESVTCAFGFPIGPSNASSSIGPSLDTSQSYSLSEIQGVGSAWGPVRLGQLKPGFSVRCPWRKPRR